MASSPSSTNFFGLRARKAATISAPVRLLPVLDCKKTFSSSRKTRQRNPSHFGSYIHLPMGKLFTARAFVGVIAEPEICLSSFWRSPHETESIPSTEYNPIFRVPEYSELPICVGIGSL